MATKFLTLTALTLAAQLSIAQADQSIFFENKPWPEAKMMICTVNPNISYFVNPCELGDLIVYDANYTGTMPKRAPRRLKEPTEFRCTGVGTTPMPVYSDRPCEVGKIYVSSGRSTVRVVQR